MNYSEIREIMKEYTNIGLDIISDPEMLGFKIEVYFPKADESIYSEYSYADTPDLEGNYVVTGLSLINSSDTNGIDSLDTFSGIEVNLLTPNSIEIPKNSMINILVDDQYLKGRIGSKIEAKTGIMNYYPVEPLN